MRTASTLYRRTDLRLVAGVARGLADHLGVDVMLVRIAFVLLAFAGGAGIVMYAAFWVFVPPAPAGPLDPGAAVRAQRSALRDPGQLLALLALAVGGLLVVQSIGLGIPGALLWPVFLAGVGVLVLWRQADDAQRARWWSTAATSKDARFMLVRTVVGAMLVAAGAATFLAYHGQLRQVRDGLLASVVILAGIALITGPWWLRTVRELATERRERIRSQERAELAAHLHDSVLHTLALIQRHVDDPREVHRLARGQERELRTWLYRPREESATTVAAAIERVAADVEDAHGANIEVVSVGDCELDDRLGSLVAAAREAMVNAAKHSGSAVSVYLEVEASSVTVFVRDRGKGFDLDAVPDDRMGVRESIVGRMERHGGTARVRTAPGDGTEVLLRMVRS